MRAIIGNNTMRYHIPYHTKHTLTQPSSAHTRFHRKTSNEDRKIEIDVDCCGWASFNPFCASTSVLRSSLYILYVCMFRFNSTFAKGYLTILWHLLKLLPLCLCAAVVVCFLPGIRLFSLPNRTPFYALANFPTCACDCTNGMTTCNPSHSKIYRFILSVCTFSYMYLWRLTRNFIYLPYFVSFCCYVNDLFVFIARATTPTTIKTKQKKWTNGHFCGGGGWFFARSSSVALTW